MVSSLGISGHSWLCTARIARILRLLKLPSLPVIFPETYALMKDACGTDIEADGMIFDAGTVKAARITENAEYEGSRVRVQGGLGVDQSRSRHSRSE